jgi:hypothetical protein
VITLEALSDDKQAGSEPHDERPTLFPHCFSRIPTMSVERLAPLLRALEAQLAKYPLFK